METVYATVPLQGIRVADFSWVLAGPICGRYLAAMGAEVIKIESSRRPDQTRTGVMGEDGRPLLNRSPNFNVNNYSKLSCTIDLTRKEGQQLAREIVQVSDIVLENFGYGVMERFGLGYDELRKIRPDIIMLSSSGLGRTGPERNYVAYGHTLHAYAGVTAITGYHGGPPRGVGGVWSDPVTAVTATFAVLAALHHRAMTGEGQFIDLSMGEATAALLVEPLLDYQLNGRVWGVRGNDHEVWAPHGCYPCKGEDRWIAIAVTNDHQWQALCEVLGAAELRTDPRFATATRRWHHRRDLDQQVAERTRAWDAWDLTHRLQEVGVPAGPSLDVEQFVHDSHIKERGFLLTVEHPEVGARLVPRLPWRMDPAVTERYEHAPLLGEHNEYVFRAVLGLPDHKYAHLVETGVIR